MAWLLRILAFLRAQLPSFFRYIRRMYYAEHCISAASCLPSGDPLHFKKQVDTGHRKEGGNLKSQNKLIGVYGRSVVKVEILVRSFGVWPKHNQQYCNFLGG